MHTDFFLHIKTLQQIVLDKKLSVNCKLWHN